ncbi:MAG: fumarylacetoacetate hydrolase family protein, partial [Flavobacteriaceae bacterium]
MKIICVGRNYSAHIAELNNERPTEPVLFMKPDTSLLQKNQPFFIPHFSQDIQYEVEIVVKIKKIGKHIEPKFAPKYYDEIGLGIDFTARTLQADLKAKGLPWEKAKAFDGSCLVSDWIDKNKFQNLKATAFSLQKNGKTV